MHWDERWCQCVRVPGKKSTHVSACGGCSMAGEWAAHCSFSLFNRERFHRRSLAEPFTAVAENSQNQETGQAGAGSRVTSSIRPGCQIKLCCHLVTCSRLNYILSNGSNSGTPFLSFDAEKKSPRRGAKSYIIGVLAYLQRGSPGSLF